MGSPPSPTHSQASLRPPETSNGGHISEWSGSPGPYGSSKWLANDPRASSTHSLVPSIRHHSDDRRTLLIIYIHGFYGNDQSFRSFPAHVHNYLKIALSETHVVHSKIYPRYKTYKAITVARDNFSKWLEPHENEYTDTILVGHSMGGLLAAEVALMPAEQPYARHLFKHRILGTLSLDSPFLGLHPGIVVAGIASLFRPASPEQKATQDDAGSLTPLSPTISTLSSPEPSMESLYTPMSSNTELTSVPSASSSSLLSGPPPKPDPFFNQPFFNDVIFKERPFVKRLVHFAKKHSAEGVFDAAKNHVMSHLEFGGCLADYPAMNSRYNKLRALEDVDDLRFLDQSNANAAGNKPQQPRVRFVNYYTISTGRIKPPKSPSPHLQPTEPSSANPSSLNVSSLNVSSPNASNLNVSSLTVSPPLSTGVSTPRISIEDYSDGGRAEILQSIETDYSEPPSPKSDDMQELAPMPLSAGTSNGRNSMEEQKKAETQDPGQPDLPAIPDAPERPQAPDLDKFTDKDARKQAEKEAKRAMKAYDQAIKNREKAIKERQKLVEKRKLKLRKDTERLEKEEHQARIRDNMVLQQKLEVAKTFMEQPQEEPKDQPKEKPKKERKFCAQPRKTNGQRDACWVQVYMEGMDEVGAHCGLFASGPHYDKLVGDVGERILGWIQEDLSRRAIIGMS